jgi:hypothetical protein
MATRPGNDHIVGIDIGGTGIMGALVDVKAGKLAGPRARLSTPHPAAPAAVAECAKVPAEDQAPDADRPGPAPERRRDHWGGHVRRERRVRHEVPS